MRNTQAALLWITQLLAEYKIPYQIAGGLAARAYGAKRDLVDIDIDIPQSGFSIINDRIKEYVIYGPAQYKDQYWDLYLVTLSYQEQEIDLSSIDKVMMFNSLTNKWEKLETDFSKSCFMEIMGIWVPVIPKNDLLAYKKILQRPVDILDVRDVESLP